MKTSDVWGYRFDVLTPDGDQTLITYQAYPFTSEDQIQEAVAVLAKRAGVKVDSFTGPTILERPGGPTERESAPEPSPERAELWRKRGYAGPTNSPLTMAMLLMENSQFRGELAVMERELRGARV